MRLRNRERRRTLAPIMLLASVIGLAVFVGAGSGAIQALAQGKFTPTPTPTPAFTLPPGGPYADPGVLGVGQTGALLFTSERNGVFDLYVAAPDGSGERQLTFGQEAVYPAWSPDGKQIAYTGGVDVTDLYLMNADGSNVRNITNSPDYERAASWSPDGQQIVFASGDYSATRLYVINADGSGLYQLNTGDLPADWPVWSPDGRQIAFFASGNLGAGLYVMNLDGSGMRFLAETNLAYAAWSPDGQRIAYVAQPNGLDEIFVVDVMRGIRQQLTSDEASDITPSWSPDGLHILFSSDRDGTYRLYSMNADGSGVQALGSTGPNYDPEWSAVVPYMIALAPTPTRGKSPMPSMTPSPMIVQPTPSKGSELYATATPILFVTQMPPTLAPVLPTDTPRPTRQPFTAVPVTPTTPPDALCVAVVPPGGDAPVRTSASPDGNQILTAHEGQWMHVFETQEVDGQAWYRVVFRVEGVRIFGWVLAEQVESLDAVAGPCPALEAPTATELPPTATAFPSLTNAPSSTPVRAQITATPTRTNTPPPTHSGPTLTPSVTPTPT